MSTTIHNFQKSLIKSHKWSEAPWWEKVYRKAFHNFASMQNIRNDGWAQRGGIDRIVTLDSGRTVLVDEKVREEDWPDILWEFYSDKDRKKPGWCAKDLACDFIAYAFIPSEICYLLPFLQMRRAWTTNRYDWCAKAENNECGFRFVDAVNEGYTTRSVAVPTGISLAAIRDAMTVRWCE